MIRNYVQTALRTARKNKLHTAIYLIAWPAAYLAMQRWLEGFAYGIESTDGLSLLSRKRRRRRRR